MGKNQTKRVRLPRDDADYFLLCTHPGRPSASEPDGHPNGSLGRMIRLAFAVFLFPLLLVVLWNDAPRWAIIGAWIIGALVVLTPYLTGQFVLKCPACGKRVKVGYTTCHHCGHAVSPG